MKRLLFLIFFMLGCQIIQAAQPRFTLWQLPPQGKSQMNSYVIKTSKDHLIVIDGGTPDDAAYLRGFLAAHGNHVTKWFITHPHIDHMGAFTKILNDPQDLQIDKIYCSPMSREQMHTDLKRLDMAKDYMEALSKTKVEVIKLTEAGAVYQIDELHIKVMLVNDTTLLTQNAYNNASIILRLWDKTKSFLMLADAGIECGERLLQTAEKAELKIDYVQMAHHGQSGVDQQFYNTLQFKACLWPTPLWVWNNDVGEGFNTAWMKTIDTRHWMDQLGIKEHYCAWQGLIKIE